MAEVRKKVLKVDWTATMKSMKIGECLKEKGINEYKSATRIATYLKRIGAGVWAVIAEKEGSFSITRKE